MTSIDLLLSEPLNASAAPTALADMLRQLLPVGRMHAEVMRLVPTAHLEELTRKLMDGARRHPQWFAQAVSKAGDPAL